MTCWFVEPSEKFNFARLGGLIDVDTANSKVTFSECVARFTEDRKAIDLYMYAVSVTDCKSAKEKSWTFSPCLAHVCIRSEEYEKYDKKKYTPTPFSLWLFDSLSKLIGSEKQVFIGGWILFQEPSASEVAKCVVSGKNANGTDLTPQVIEYMQGQYFDLQVIDKLEKVKLEELPEPSKTNGGGFQKGYAPKEGEKDRLAARAVFVLETYKPVCDAPNLAELSAQIVELKASTPELANVLDRLTTLVLST